MHMIIKFMACVKNMCTLHLIHTDSFMQPKHVADIGFAIIKVVCPEGLRPV